MSAAAAPRDRSPAFHVAPNGDDANAGSSASPFRTLERARLAVRAISAAMTSDITVFVRGGEYRLDHTLVFDQNDSGRNGHSVIYRPASNEVPVITGGRRISGWLPAGSGIFKASVGEMQFRQLYVNGVRAIRAREPNEGYYRLRAWDVPGRRIEIDLDDLPPGVRLRELEMNVQKQWNQNILRVAAASRAGPHAFVTPDEPERTRSFVQTAPPREDNQRYHFENLLELLDAPGEWHLDVNTHEVFYKPRPGEDLATAIVVAPVLETLVRFQGTLDSPVRKIVLCGLVLEHTTWMRPSREGFIGDQAGTGFHVRHQVDESLFYDVIRMPAGVHLEAAENIRLVRNVVRHMGGTGVQLQSATRENAIVGNVVTDISGNGISVDMKLEGNPRDPREVSRRDVIENNIVAGVGRDYYGSVGIHAGYPEALRIEHNEVTDVPYTGISVGWGWSLRTTALRDNLIRYNHVHGVMRLLADGGGIYTLSRQPGTRIEGNHVHDLVRARSAGSFPIAGVYLDNGSDEITVRGNVLRDVPMRIHLNRGGPAPAGANNLLVDNEAAPQSVIDNAGLERPYRDLLQGAIRQRARASAVATHGDGC